MSVLARALSPSTRSRARALRMRGRSADVGQIDTGCLPVIRRRNGGKEALAGTMVHMRRARDGMPARLNRCPCSNGRGRSVEKMICLRARDTGGWSTRMCCCTTGPPAYMVARPLLRSVVVGHIGGQQTAGAARDGQMRLALGLGHGHRRHPEHTNRHGCTRCVPNCAICTDY